MTENPYPNGIRGEKGDGWDEGYAAGRADALREAADRVRALEWSPDDGVDRDAVLAVLDSETG